MDLLKMLENRKDKINTTSPLGLSQVNLLAQDIFAKSAKFAADREILGQSEKSQKILLRASSLREFPTLEKVGWERYRKILLACSHKEELGRSLILHYLRSVTFGLKEYEVEILKTSCQVGKLYDAISLKWREDVMINDLNRSAKKLELNNKYSIIRKLNNKIVQIPYSVIYKQEISEICKTWEQLALKLIKFSNDESKGLSEYFLAYCQALEDENLKTINENWLGLSRVWMKNVTGRLQPIHGEEYSYYDQNSIRVFPDFRLSIKVEALEKVMSATQKSLEVYLGASFGETQIYKTSLTALKKVQLFPIIDVVYCGSLDFQPAGQSLPNDDRVQKEYGTKVFLNGEVIDSRWKIALDLAQKVFPKDFKMFTDVDTQYDGTAIMVAGHEYGEPLFTDLAVVESLGEQTEALLNEDIATLCITGIMPQKYKNKEIDEKSYLNHAMDLLGSYLRYIDTARGVSYLQPYYVGMCLLGLRRMLDSGFIFKDKSDWRINPNKLDLLYALSLADLHQQVLIAETKSKSKALNYLAYGQETKEILEIIKLAKAN